MTPHIESEEFAAYLSGGVDATTRERLEAHLAECRACRNELITARRLVAGSTRFRHWPYVATGMIAAGLAMVMLMPRSRSLPTPGERERGDPVSATTEVIQSVTPVEFSTVSVTGVVFTWRSAGGQPLYRLSLGDATGRELWRMETSDTTLTLPDSIMLERDRTFYWYVDGLTASGRSISTGARSFTTSR